MRHQWLLGLLARGIVAVQSGRWCPARIPNRYHTGLDSAHSCSDRATNRRVAQVAWPRGAEVLSPGGNQRHGRVERSYLVSAAQFEHRRMTNTCISFLAQ